MRKLLLCAFLLAFQTKPLVNEAPPEEPTIVSSPMHFEVSLAGDGTPKKPHLVDLPYDRTRLSRETGNLICDGLMLRNVAVKKHAGRAGAVDLVVTLTMSSESFRQSADVTVNLVANGKTVRQWKDSVGVGMQIGELVVAGPAGLGARPKTSAQEFKFHFKSEKEFKALIGMPDAALVIEVRTE